MTAEVLELLDTHKSKAAFLAPLVTALLAAAGSWVVTGDWNDAEIRTAVSGALLGLASAFATYVTPAGQARVSAPVEPRKPGIYSERGYSLVEVLVACFICVLILIAVLALLSRV